MDDYKSFFLMGITGLATCFIALCLGLVMGMKGAVLGLFLVPSLVLSFRYPYWGLLAFLVYLPFGGTITYAIAGVFQKVGSHVTYENSSSALFHLAKDVFYLPALVAIALKPWDWKSLLTKMRPLAIAIAFLTMSCLITFVSFQLFHSGQSALMGIIGLKVMLGYIPLILCGIYLSRDRLSLVWFLRFWLILILLCCSLALIQFTLLTTGICHGSVDLSPPINTRASLHAQCFVGGSLLYNPGKDLLRLPGTFVSPWQWAWFLISSCFISYATSLFDPTPRWRIVAGVAIATVLGATLVSGQKTALLVVPFFFLVQLVLTETRKKRLAIKLGLIAFLSAIIVSQVGFLQILLANFIARWDSPYSPISFIINQARSIIKSDLTLFGHGLGTTASAARRLGEIRLIEVFYAKILYEIGMVGFIAFIGVLLAIAVLTWQSYRSLTDPRFRVLGLCLWLFIIFISLNPYYYPLMVDPVTVYYWLVAGILIKLPDLENMTVSLPLELPKAWRAGDYGLQMPPASLSE